MTPPERLRLELGARRAQGLDFGGAWPAAVRVALEDVKGSERSRWSEAFASTSGAWASAWYRHTAPPAVRAAAALRELSEPVAVRSEAA